jgi:hypothetical protein
MMVMAELERSEVLHRNPVTQQGFTMIPNAVLTASRLSSGARLLYGLLKMHAWQADNAFPGQDRLAGYLGVSTRQVRTYQTELEDAGLITIEQRGLRQTNRYWIEDIPASFLSDRKPTSDQDRNGASDQDRKPTSDKENTVVKNTQKEEESTPARATRDMTYPPGTAIKPVPKPSDDPTITALLDELRPIYPFRDGKCARPALAKRALATLTPAERAQLVIAAGNYAASRDGLEGYAQDLHTWIEGEAWREYLTPATPRPLRLVSNGPPAPVPLPRLDKAYLQAQKGR